ncbi:Rieske 2Fe-2S domain-containing protein [Pseudonocardia sp. GCM10023141]|uniref:aromatic ring-hydroxylating dioxygenase subunit alpha n=1 Tax=Pseudonocardia sp. GCM10023141 TaxID=3252653 RepID=UPI00360F3F0E
MTKPAGPPTLLQDDDRPAFPLDAWYAVGWDHEVGRTLRPVRVADQPLVLYRRTDGQAVALADSCWHRLVPLSMGALIGDEVECGYHGIRYDGDGRATFMPAQQTLNPSACVRSYPVVERHRFVWVWTGDPARADPDRVPDMHWNADPGWAGDGTSIRLDCDYRLILDNLMDLTHEAFVHRSTLAQAEINHERLDVVHDGSTVTATKWMLGITPPPFWSAQLQTVFPDYAGPVDRWQIINFAAPSTITIDVGIAKAGTGAPQGDRSHGVANRILNTITPETATTCHYFWAIARDYRLGEQRITTQLRDGVTRVFAEDVAMLTAQQRAIEANPGHAFYNLNIDAGGMWARRAIDALVDRELAGAVPAGTGR